MFRPRWYVPRNHTVDRVTHVEVSPGTIVDRVPALQSAPAAVSVRPLESLADFHACVALQADVWGREFTDGVPASLLQVSTYVGGLALGAFTEAGEIVGMLFGLTGTDGVEIVHWSHLLGVRDSVRNLGVGRLLKEAQRTELARRGIRKMSWTFDPLVAKNAYLNLNRLGATVVRYVPNMYGTTGSPLHYGIATDRLIVSVDTSAVAPDATTLLTKRTPLPVLSPEMRGSDLPIVRASPPPALWLEVPNDIRQVIEHQPRAATAWRESVRENFQWALGLGYEVKALQRDPVTSRAFYVLRRAAT